MSRRRAAQSGTEGNLRRSSGKRCEAPRGGHGGSLGGEGRRQEELCSGMAREDDGEAEDARGREEDSSGLMRGAWSDGRVGR